jgi:hypothetical protein
VPDLKDAIEVVTDPVNVIASGDHHSSMRQLNGKRAVAALRAQGAGRAAARDLVTEAVLDLGGRVDSEVRTGGRAVGPDSKTAAELWFVPADAVRPEYPKPDE